MSSSAAQALQVRQHLHAHHAGLSPVLALLLSLAAWGVVALVQAPWAWAAAVTLIAVAYVLICRIPLSHSWGPGAAGPALALAAALVLGLGAALFSPTPDARLVAPVLLALAASALPLLAVRPVLLGAFTLLLTLPLLWVQFASGDVRLAWVLVGAVPALLVGQGIGARSLTRAMRNDAEQRALLRRMEEANQLLSEDRLALQTESRTDPLTGLANRRYMEETLQAEWNRCRRSDAPLSCVMLDVDHFKAYNDHYGHDGGDGCLRRIAVILRDSTRRAGDVVARIGGEEFVVLLPETGAEGAATVADFLKRAVADAGLPHAQSPIASHVTISLGVATLVPDPERMPGELLKGADLALYEAKRSGRNRVTVADAETLESARLAARGLIG